MKIRMLLILPLLAVSSMVFALLTGNQSVSAADCKPYFEEGAYGNQCPPGADVPGYEGHTYHEINVRTTVTDPSGLYNGGYGSTETVYCDCGRATAKCRVYAEEPRISGRTGSFRMGNSEYAGGANGERSYVTFEYVLDPVPPFELTTSTTVDKPTSRVGDVVTFKHSVNKVSGKFLADNQITWKGIPTREGPLYPYTYASVLEKIRANSRKTQLDNRYLSTTTGKGYAGGTTQVTIQKDTPAGVKICYKTSVNPSNNRDGTYTTGNVCTVVGSADFNLVPSVERDKDGPAEAGESVKVSYYMQNTIGNAKEQSNMVNWRTYGIKVKPGVNIAPITNGAPRENTTPEAMVALLGAGNGTLFDLDAPKGDSTFPASAKTNVTNKDYKIPDDAPGGTRYCFLMMVAPPNQSGAPTNRHSTASCITVGKKSRIIVYGGDLYVGRHFTDDPSSSRPLNSMIQTSLLTKGGATGKTYGSWTEYDAYAPGPVSGFGTGSGLQGGAPVSSQQSWSKLTFVNVAGKYGAFSSSNTLGAIPDTANAVIDHIPVARNLESSVNELSFNADSATGRYQKTDGDLTLNVSTLGKGKSIVVAVPNGRVTIAGNLNYPSGPYGSSKELSQLVIIAKNITINAPVTSVSAWLIAKYPEGATAVTDETKQEAGVIKTCEVNPPLTVRDCNQPLAINGPIMANQLLLRRTGGMVTATEAEAAETFNLRADSYLWLYEQGRSSARAITTYTRELPVRF